MNTQFLLLFCALSLFNVIIQTVKSLCTVKSSTFVAACVNALAYGVYVYVIVFTNSEGLPLWGKALITACANFTGVYIANFFFNKFFTKEVSWVVDVSVPKTTMWDFEKELIKQEIVFREYGINSDEQFASYGVFCPNKETSKKLKEILPANSVYNIVENRKRL